jgi:hypothetical protein
MLDACLDVFGCCWEVWVWLWLCLCLCLWLCASCDYGPIGTTKQSKRYLLKFEEVCVCCKGCLCRRVACLTCMA